MRARQIQGYTLIEMLIVIALLALIAAVATPAFDGDNDVVLDRAAADVAAAMRFAHAEAIRTGEPYGVNANQFGQSVKVYRLDDSVIPAVIHYDVRNPLTKQIYDLRFGGGGAEVGITSVYFKFDGFFFPQDLIGFSGATGVPKYNDSGTIRMLETGYVRLGLDGLTRTISVAPVTGRVTIQ
ncbi:MAG: prepilin-type N-terminal cleavage/methylation domain-containing protein [Gammaproteobacteria bacterium]|nr:prepilin-type N-terminal cleavage/methylation domain-containing protein [Gammaproteobacteria bacterium]MDH3430107.1 prepilin-type N-terminal cleavage/methylation domain-containing protein [Gammaproteobacteria bacterium]